MGPPGHFAIALAVKPAAPNVPLWVLLLGSEALDVFSFAFTYIGIEKIGVRHIDIHQGVTILSPGSISWSHGLFMSVVWSLAAAAIAFLIFHDRRSAGAIGLVVFSHWVLDFIVHPPDLPLFLNNSPRVGLGLWKTGTGLILSCILEIAMFTAGMVIYLTWRKRNAAGIVVEPVK